jgi:hypothetical protein
MGDIFSTPRQFAGSEELLYKAGSARAGRKFDGALAHCEGLEVLLSALDHSPALSPAGRDFTWDVLINSTAARIWAMNGWIERPDCLRKKIEDPIVIIGMPRTGTTALHKVLALDPQFQGLEHWLIEYPKPRPPRESWPEDPTYQAVVRTLTAKLEAGPGLKMKHFEVAEEVDECILLLRHTFVSNFWGECVDLPEYDEWWMAQDEGKVAYPWHADILRLISADDDRTWLLKNPGHTWSIEALFANFPRARVIQTHRRMDRAFSSICSLVIEMRKLSAGPNADPNALGRRDLKVWGESLKRTMAFRDKHPEGFIDIWHDDINADPIGVIRSLYRQLGLTLTAEVEKSMLAGIAARPERHHGAHHHTLEMFGVTPRDVEKAFGEYTARYKLDEPRRMA